uniref:(northern house mosquito) hypothetical protein n=1 Tax=Culex pipiens TaxID=7175 RepID=A0A8D8D1W8_CULPI
MVVVFLPPAEHPPDTSISLFRLGFPQSKLVPPRRPLAETRTGRRVTFGSFRKGRLGGKILPRFVGQFLALNRGGWSGGLGWEVRCAGFFFLVSRRWFGMLCVCLG